MLDRSGALAAASAASIFYGTIADLQEAVVWEQMPIFGDHGSYVWPSWAGLAVWVTTPALFSGLFVHIGAHRRLTQATGVAIALACAVAITRAVTSGVGGRGLGMPPGAALLPFWAAV